MNRKILKYLLTNYIHFLFWFVYYGVELVIEKTANIFNITSIFRYFLGICLFYILLNLFKKPNDNTKYKLLILSFLVFLLLSLFLKFETFNLFQNFKNPTINVQILYVIDNFMHLGTLAFIFHLLQKLTEIHYKKVESEKQVYLIETIYLNMKIDDHFFRNSINVFYSKLLKTKSKTAQKLIKLADYAKKYLQ